MTVNLDFCLVSELDTNGSSFTWSRSSVTSGLCWRLLEGVLSVRKVAYQVWTSGFSGGGNFDVWIVFVIGCERYRIRFGSLTFLATVILDVWLVLELDMVVCLSLGRGRRRQVVCKGPIGSVDYSSRFSKRKVRQSGEEWLYKN